MTPSRILIADPNPDSARFLQSSLLRAGYSVPVVATHGREALDRASLGAPDLVLVRSPLPGDPGAFETARQLIRLYHVPVLFLAQADSNFSLNRAKVPFGTGYLLEPFSEGDLLSAVAGALLCTTTGAARERQHRFLEQALTALPVGVIATDLAGLVTYLNPRVEAQLNLPHGDRTGSPLAQLLETIPPETAITSIPLEQPDQSISGCLHVLRPSVPEQSSAHPTCADLVEKLPDPILVLSEELTVTHLNAPAAALLGAPAEMIVGTPLKDHLPPSASEVHSGALEQALQAGAPHSFQLHLEFGDTWWQARAFPRPGEILLLLQDVTAQKRATAEAERLSRLEALSHLARGFTHDFNNLLTILMGNLALARTQTGPGELMRLLEEAESATQRARDLVEQLTTFAKGGAPIKGMIPLRPILNEVLARRPASARIAYHIQYDGTEFTLDADPKQLRRLLENLILNAEQAITGTGHIHIRCHRPEDPGADSTGHNLVIEIRDTGCGMSEETQKKAFDPFFTTRTQVNATGLGLTVCESIAKAHGGSIRLTSQPGEGTAAEVRLPIHSPEPQSAPGLLRNRPLNGRPTASRDSSGALRRILVLEDETLLRRLIHSTLTLAGFQVDETWDGQQTVDAYRQAQERGQPYDLLIMDLAIENGMGGVEAMSRIRNLDPAALAIVSSGYSDDPAMSRPRDYGFTFVLPKPYPPIRLVEAVEQLLAERKDH